MSRYSAVRKQFGPPGKGEIPVLEYQMQVCEASALCKGWATPLLVNKEQVFFVEISLSYLALCIIASKW